MSLLLHRPLPIRSASCTRVFSSTPTRHISLQLEKNDPEAVADTVPAYPYGPARWYKQSSKGLYGGQTIQFGNNVGPKSEVKSRRSWGVNVFRKKLYSQALGRFVQVRVAARVLRTIDKLGGLDEYLLGEKEGRIRELGESGWWLRWAIMRTPAIRKRFAAERQRLGLPPDGIEEMVDEAETTEEGEALLAAMADGEGEEALLESAPVATDNAFEIEQPPNLPRLKFRVGPGAHLVLTSNGWRRTRPDYEFLLKRRILKRNERLRDYVDAKIAKLDEALDQAIEHQATAVAKAAVKDRGGRKAALQQQTKVKLNEEEKDVLRKSVRRVLRTEMRGMVGRRVERIVERKKEGVRLRNRRALVKRASRAQIAKFRERKAAGAALN